MPSLGVMELGRQLCGKMRRPRRAEGPVTVPMRGLEIHFYLPDIHPLLFLKDSFTAEELCVEAAKRCCKYCFNSCCVCPCLTAIIRIYVCVCVPACLRESECVCMPVCQSIK